jgi:hypothetical protein
VSEENTPRSNQEALGPLVTRLGHLREPTAISEIESAYYDLITFAVEITNDKWQSKPNDDELLLAGLLASLLEYGETLWFLIRAKHGAACGAILRAQVEIVAILAQHSTSTTPHRDESAVYLKQLKSSEHKHAALTKAGKDIYAIPVEDHIRQIEEKYPGINASSRQFGEIIESVSPKLLQIYKHLCLEAHNNLPAINHRHLRGNAVAAFAPLPTRVAEQYLRWSAFCHVDPLTRYLKAITDDKRKIELDRLYDAVIKADPA